MEVEYFTAECSDCINALSFEPNCFLRFGKLEGERSLKEYAVLAKIMQVLSLFT